MRVIRFRTAKTPEAIEESLNGLKDTTILGAPVWDGKRWVVWFITTNEKIKSGDVD